MLPDPQRVARIIEEIAAEEILPRFRALADAQIRRKRSGELVTDADLAAEAALEGALTAVVPGSRAVGEEAVEANPQLLDRLTGDDVLWILDPIDGTGNFAAGRPTFAVMVALVRGNETLASWIHDPPGGRTAIAEHGGGSYLDGRRLRAAAGDSPAEMRGTLHAGTYGGKELARRLERRRERVKTLPSLRCAGHEYLRLAAGEMHFSLFTKVQPWDHLPGLLLHSEAGGVARLLDGRTYSPHHHTGPGLLIAPDLPSWQALYDTLIA